MGALGRECPEIPLAIVIGPPGVRPTFLGVDEIRELGGVPDEEDRSVVANEVVVALLGVELQGETPGVPNRVRKTLFAGNGRESGHHRRTGALFQEVGLAPLADVLGGLKEPKGPVTLGVHDVLGDPLPIEVGHLLK